MTLLGRVLLHVRAGLWTMQEMASGCGPELIESTRGAVAARRFPNIVGAGGMASFISMQVPTNSSHVSARATSIFVQLKDTIFNKKSQYTKDLTLLLGT